jgi:hypothetical protein
MRVQIKQIPTTGTAELMVDRLEQNGLSHEKLSNTQE